MRTEDYFESEEFAQSMQKQIDFYAAYADESDRGAAVLAHARFEHWLFELLKSILSSQDEQTARELGFLRNRSFWVKMQNAFALGLIDRKNFDRLKALNDIRNRFAHHPAAIGFDDEVISRSCRSLETGHPSAQDDPRTRYMATFSQVRVEIVQKAQSRGLLTPFETSAVSS